MKMPAPHMEERRQIRLLTPEECYRYAALRRAGAIGVLWADGGRLYYAAKPSAAGCYERAQALWIDPAAMERLIVGAESIATLSPERAAQVESCYGALDPAMVRLTFERID